MANRSHLYTCDEVPGGQGFYARGLSETSYDIPLVHKLMVANNPRIVRSAIWEEHEIAILAERAGAFERAIALFEKLAQGDLDHREEFDEELAAMKEFLASAPPSKYILLEPGEILDMADGELPTLIGELHAEISELAARADAAIAGGEDTWVGELRAAWQDKARPGYWSDILYYSFEPGGASDEDAPAVAVEGDEAAPPAEAELDPGAAIDDGWSDAGDDVAPDAGSVPVDVTAEAVVEPEVERGTSEDPEPEQPAVEPEPAVVTPAAANKPVANKPVANKPAANKPAANKPAANKPAANKPTKKPAANKPTKKPAANKPAKKPAAKKPAKKPAAKKPAKKPATKKPAAKKPATKKPAAKKPAAKPAKRR